MMYDCRHECLEPPWITGQPTQNNSAVGPSEYRVYENPHNSNRGMERLLMGDTFVLDMVSDMCTLLSEYLVRR